VPACECKSTDGLATFARIQPATVVVVAVVVVVVTIHF
jgi:hypothetical protein